VKLSGLRIHALLLAPGLAGCIATTPVQVTDRDVFVPSARVSVQLSGGEEAPSRPHSGSALELGVTGASGSDGQSLAAGQLPVVVGGQTFTGPQQLTNQFDFRYYEAVYRGRMFFDDLLGLEFLGGLAFTSLDLTVTSPGRRATEARSDGGISAGIGGLVRMLPSTILQARWTAFVSSDTSAQRIEIHAVQAFGRNVALRAGWTDWKLSSKDNFSSEFRIRFSGPALGLDLMF